MSVDLSPAQRSIVEAGDGHYLVIAAAGSGKTRVLTERVRYLLETRKIRSRILALTFTNKAAGEMRERLQAIPDLSDRTFIGTIHSFCQTIIEAHGTAIGYPRMPAILEREADRIAMLEEAFLQSAELGGYLRRHGSAKERRKFLYNVLEMISLCKRDIQKYEAIQSGEWESAEEVQVFLEYQRHLASQGVIDFDDILLLAYRILSERPAIAAILHRTYRYLFVDEAQDLNPVQYALVRTLGENAASTLLVGDPNQAIYGFNGSSKEFMLEEFPKDFTVERVELRENFRSSRAVIAAANALYPDSISNPNAAREGEIEILSCIDEEAEAQWATDKIRALLQMGSHQDIEGIIRPSRIAVLARNRYVFGPLQEQLTAQAIEFHLKLPGGGAALESDLAQIFDLGIRILVNPKNRLHLNELEKRLSVTALKRPQTNDSVVILENLCESVPAASRQTTELLLDAWKHLHADVNRFSIVLQSLEIAVNEWEVGQDGQSEAKLLALSDLSFLQTVWRNYSQSSGKDNRTLGQFRNQMATGEIVPNVEGKGLTLATVHAVKGLEFDIVFLIGLVEGGFPDYRAVKAGRAALAEEKNDAFVAVTRSKRLLYLTWPQSKFMPWDRENRARQRKSRFLAEIESGIDNSLKVTSSTCVAEDSSPYPRAT
jgi:DNA helicase II / ATP-dependent DNA helicase PcrA